MGNVTNFQVPGGPPIDDGQPISSPPPGTSTPTTGVDANDISTISKSNSSSTSTSADASIPNLMIPYMMMYNNDNVGADSISIAGVATTQAKIMQSMLDGWLASQDEMKKRDIEERNSAEYLAKMQRESPSSVNNVQIQNIEASTTAVNADIRATNAHAPDRLPPLQNNDDFSVGFSNAVNNYNDRLQTGDSNSISMLPTMVNVVIGVTVAGANLDIDNIARVTTPSEQVFEELYVAMSNATTNDNAAAMAGYFGALFAGPLIFQANAEVALKSPGGAPDLEFTKAYGNAVLDLVKNTGFDQFLSDALTDKLGNSIVSDERRQKLIANVKLTLIANAIGLIEKTDAGGMTGKDFMAIINGTMKGIPEGDVRLKLAEEFNKVLSPEDFDPSAKPIFTAQEKANILSALQKHWDSNPSTQSMLKANRLPQLADVSSEHPV